MALPFFSSGGVSEAPPSPGGNISSLSEALESSTPSSEELYAKAFFSEVLLIPLFSLGNWRLSVFWRKAEGVIRLHLPCSGVEGLQEVF